MAWLKSPKIYRVEVLVTLHDKPVRLHTYTYDIVCRQKKQAIAIAESTTRQYVEIKVQKVKSKGKTIKF